MEDNPALQVFAFTSPDAGGGGRGERADGFGGGNGDGRVTS